MIESINQVQWPGGRNSITPPAASPERWLLLLPLLSGRRKKVVINDNQQKIKDMDPGDTLFHCCRLWTWDNILLLN